MKSGKTTLLLSLAAFLLGIGIAHFTLPAKVITKTVEVQGKERIVYKDKIVDRTKITTTKPDGTTIVVEKDVTKDNSGIREVEVKISEKLKIVDSRQLSFGISAIASSSIRNFGTPAYGAMVEYRVMGPVWLSVYGLSDLSGGIGLGFKF